MSNLSQNCVNSALRCLSGQHLLPVFYGLIVISLGFAGCEPRIDHRVAVEELDKQWQFRQATDHQWHPATVPGTVQTDLLANGLIDDPYFGDNEEKVQWIEKEDWIYQTTFDADRTLLEKAHIDLHFEGLDTYASIYLNGHLIGQTENMFRDWTFRVKDKLKDGRNELQLTFHSPVRKTEAQWQALGFELPGGPRVMTRKAPFHFGWDWGPRLVTSGLWKPAYLRSWNFAAIRDLFIRQDSLTTDTAYMTAVFEVDAEKEGYYTFSIAGSELLALGDRLVEKGNSIVELSFTIAHPELWWPNGYGKPHLYRLTAEMAWFEQLVDIKQKAIGIRTVELLRQPDSLGTGFAFRINGVPVFMKGANYIPQDNFQTRVTPRHYKQLIADAIDANMNMLRVWGGGIYEQEIFYRLCDENGLLVWQDFMFACAMYPGDPAFLENVREEAVSNIKRLRGHPCIALWCGNNEVSEGWHRWGWQDPLTDTQKTVVWKAYQDIFQRILPEAVEDHAPGMAYWESSPQFGRGDPRHQFEGDAHYWGVWHDAEPFEMLIEKVPRFMSEYGFQSFPEWKTIESFTQPGDRDLRSTVMQSHQKHPRGNTLIQTYMDRSYRPPKDFPSFVYVSQLLQAGGISLGIEAHRRSKPYCMGTLYWQLNDCWPVASWSGRDYYGRWKALHHYVRKAYSPVLVSPLIDVETLKVYVISDLTRPVPVTIRAETFDFEGQAVWQGDKDTTLEALSSAPVWTLELAAIRKNRPKEALVIRTRVVAQDSTLSENLAYLVKPAQLNLAPAAISFRASEQVGKIRLEGSTDKLAKNVYLSIPGDGRFSDNYFDMIPGIPIVITYEGDLGIEALERSLSIMSLVDTYTLSDSP